MKPIDKEKTLLYALFINLIHNEDERSSKPSQQLKKCWGYIAEIHNFMSCKEIFLSF